MKTIYNVSTQISDIERIMINWGTYAGLLERDKKGIIKLKVVVEELKPEYLKELLEALESDIKARIYMENKLTDEVFGYLQYDEIEFLVKAIRNHQKDARASIEDMGKAFEDFLRRLGNDKKVDMTKSSGIAQCAYSLKGADLITQKHLEVCEHINTFRLAAAHSKEKQTLEAWKINPDAAIEVILTALTAIRSIFIYVFRNRQVL
jgi:uncharacterized protein YmfQ (DUF2313 family)